ncbi:MAG: CoA ester lyase [Mycobacterium sp.]
MTAYTIDQIISARTFLFVPGDRPDRFAKAAAAGPDIVIIDLEDAVAPSAKNAARDHTLRWLADGNPAMVRINGTDTEWHRDDVAALADFPSAAVMLPKTERLDQVTNLSAAIVVALVETAAGIAAAAAVGSLPGVHRLAFGSIDLAAQLGVDPADREALLVARSAVVLASAQAGLPPPIDGVTTDVANPESTVADMRHARSLGMAAKLCIHPNQVAAVHQALAPTPDEITWAQAIVGATDSASGAVSVDGQMVDLPVLARARNILATTTIRS